MDNLVRWNMTVSLDTDLAVRALLETRDRRRRGLSRFVEEAVNREIMRCTLGYFSPQDTGREAAS